MGGTGGAGDKIHVDVRDAFCSRRARSWPLSATRCAAASSSRYRVGLADRRPRHADEIRAFACGIAIDPFAAQSISCVSAAAHGYRAERHHARFWPVGARRSSGPDIGFLCFPFGDCAGRLLLVACYVRNLRRRAGGSPTGAQNPKPRRISYQNFLPDRPRHGAQYGNCLTGGLHRLCIVSPRRCRPGCVTESDAASPSPIRRGPDWPRSWPGLAGSRPNIVVSNSRPG